ncbi:hypothetical protein [Thalassovita aquimarina]|uniref:Uncharacterized protein n=1 Tax=Thalassovita aquimarina TaxID=2785917 RepID=A0ABS5HMU1_9RHOB|nr:hypothetical protein [Thalassovita aquimarina]MBR9650243.1 hypothetical protein [Thalassovita aquimarina]
MTQQAKCFTHLTTAAKWAFTTRRVPSERVAGLSPALDRARSGDLVLAEVVSIGSHKRLQTREGRRSTLFPGDFVVLACGDRFAMDQFEGHAELQAGGSDMLASGGVLGTMIARNARVSTPTRLRPLGLLIDGAGAVISVADHALPPHQNPSRPDLVLAVVGSGMNAGKTDATAWLLRGFSLMGLRTVGVKLTGTGSFGDTQAYTDAGAAMALDFTDAGMSSSYRQPVSRIVAAHDLLMSEAAAQGCDVAVIELADGVTQVETAELLNDKSFAQGLDGVLFACAEPLAAMAGMAWLSDRGITPLAVTGRITSAPLAVAEVAALSDVPVLSREALADPVTASALSQTIRQRRKTRHGLAA